MQLRISWMQTHRLTLLLFLFCPLVLLSDEPIRPAKWSFDVLHLKNGSTLKGLLLEESQNRIRFQDVRQHPGRPTIIFTMSLPRKEIEKLDKLSSEDREILKGRLQELDPNGNGERARMEKLDLKHIDWKGKPKSALRYESDFFILSASASEELVRRSAVRLEQIYTAYLRFLPPKETESPPSSIWLIDSQPEYEKLLKSEGRKFLNPAFYDPKANRIVVCVSDLKKLGDELDRFRKDCSKLSEELDSQEAELRRLYSSKKPELIRHLQPIQEMRKNIAAAEKQNDALFNKATKQHFKVLYHEAFHAYLGTFVFPSSGSRKEIGEPPRWLNEGLAQIFETAVLEAGELRIGHADPERLTGVKELLKKGQIIPVRDVLTSGAKEFIVIHGGDRLGSDRIYLTSWALASYLLFEKRLIGTSALDEFVSQLNKREDPIAAFTKLVHQPLEEFEKGFHSYIQRLQSDGTLFDISNGKPKD
jgi:hypothetical protein